MEWRKAWSKCWNMHMSEDTCIYVSKNTRLAAYQYRAAFFPIFIFVWALYYSLFIHLFLNFYFDLHIYFAIVNSVTAFYIYI